jgi:anthranilate synthase/aminodeoxychorismate synthase-like glutamine amidotransferase
MNGEAWRVEPNWAHREDGEVVILDNRDSFVYNLAHRCFELGERVAVVRSEGVDIPTLISWNPAALIVSPGPGHPRDFPTALEAIAVFADLIPILGVCLGHQAIVQAYGGEVQASGKPWHGRSSRVFHDERGLFGVVPNPVEAGRYHSLSVSLPLPEDLMRTAWCDDMVMGIRHRTLPVFGVQFHPESVLTPDGYQILENFLGVVNEHRRKVSRR